MTDEDLDAIELFYDERECPIQIELCPLVSTDLVAKLQARGYVLKGFENELACALPVDPCRRQRTIGGRAHRRSKKTMLFFARPSKALPCPDSLPAAGWHLRRT